MIKLSKNGKKSISWKWITIVIVILASVFGMIVALYQSNPTGPIPSKKITIIYTHTTMDSIGSWMADAGRTFLIFNMTIENHGYDKFYVSPLDFEAVVDGVVYSYSILTYFLDEVGYIPMQPVYVLDNGKILCAISFEVPKDYQSALLRHKWITGYNIEWISA